MFSVYLVSIDEHGPFGLAMVVAFGAPLEGFSNAVVFISAKLNNRARTTSNVTTTHDSTRSSVRRIISSIVGTISSFTFGRANHGFADHVDNVSVDEKLQSLVGMDPSAALAVLNLDDIPEHTPTKVILPEACKDETNSIKPEVIEQAVVKDTPVSNVGMHCELSEEDEEVGSKAWNDRISVDHGKEECQPISIINEDSKSIIPEMGGNSHHGCGEMGMEGDREERDNEYEYGHDESEAAESRYSDEGSEDDSPCGLLYPASAYEGRKDWSIYLLPSSNSRHPV